MTLVNRDNQAVWTVISQTKLNKPDTVYNFEVEELYAYHMGELGVWVHNTCVISLKVIGGRIANTSRKFYPSVPDLRTDRPISFPAIDLKIIKVSKRVIWNSQEIGKFIKS